LAANAGPVAITALRITLVTDAEAEGFEPPVPLGTLAFKASAL